MGCLFGNKVSSVRDNTESYARDERKVNRHSVVGHHVVKASHYADGREIDDGQRPVLRRG